MKISSIRKYSMWPEKKLVKCFIVCFLYIYDFVPSHTSLFILATEFVLNVCSLSFLAFLQFTHSMFSSSIFFSLFARSLARQIKRKLRWINVIEIDTFVYLYIYICVVFIPSICQKKMISIWTREPFNQFGVGYWTGFSFCMWQTW